MNIVYFGTYRAEYSRNKIMIAALRAAGHTVMEVHEPLWQGEQDRVQAASGGWRRPAFGLRLLKVYGRLLRRGLALRGYDVMVCGYPGALDVFLARLLTWLQRRPLVWDVFMSTYLIALERGLERRSAFSLRLLRLLEWLALRLPDRLVQDTQSYVAWLSRQFGIPEARFGLVPTGADERVFAPQAAYDPAAEPFLVVYYGSYIPNHHVETIVGAAELLQGEPGIRFLLIGDGPDRPAAASRVAEQGLANLEMDGWMPAGALADRVGRAGLVLGAFGDTPQSMMTVHNKVFEGLALGLPVLTGDSPAVRQALAVGSEIMVCARKDPASLAQAIRSLWQDPGLRARLAHNGRQAYQTRFSLARQGEAFANILASAARRRA